MVYLQEFPRPWLYCNSKPGQDYSKSEGEEARGKVSYAAMYLSLTINQSAQQVGGTKLSHVLGTSVPFILQNQLFAELIFALGL